MFWVLLIACGPTNGGRRYTAFDLGQGPGLEPCGYLSDGRPTHCFNSTCVNPNKRLCEEERATCDAPRETYERLPTPGGPGTTFDCPRRAGVCLAGDLCANTRERCHVVRSPCLGFRPPRTPLPVPEPVSTDIPLPF